MKKFGFLTKLLTVAMVVLMCLNPAVVAFSNIASAAADDNLMYFHGDLNSDDKINAFDYILVKRHCLKTITLNEEQLLRGDVNQSGEIDKFDYILIKRHCLKTYTIGKIEICKHDLENIPAADATCTEDGNIAYYRCTECEKLYSDADAKNEITLSQTVIDAIGHSEVIDARVEPTCSETGLTEGKHCSVCNEVTVPQNTITKLPHTPSSQSCTEEQICTVCKEVLKAADGHIHGAEATCTEDQICIVCTTVLNKATGHNLNYAPEKDPIDNKNPGNCAYWQCENCKKCYLDEAATQEIPFEDIAWKLFKVTYYCDEINSKQIKWYKVGTEVEELLVPKIDGYDFKYWKDGYGKRANSISASNTENIDLYAVVELKTYTIYLGGTWNYNNITYTIEDQVDLPTPIEDGLIFADWRDPSGKVEKYVDSVGKLRWRIPKGTFGDIELMAQWKDNRNLIVPDTRNNADRYIDSGYDENAKRYWFLYSLGEIQNVVLDPENSLIKTKHNGGHIAGSLTLADTVTVEESVGQSVSESVSHTITNSTDWSKTTTWEESATLGQGVSVTVGAEAGTEFAKAKFEASFNTSLEQSKSFGEAITIGGSNGEAVESSGTSETSFVYNTTLSQSKERSITFTHDVAPGNYYYANVGTVKVYAFIVFDPVKNNYDLETISVLEANTTTAVLSDQKKDREYVSGKLSYDIYVGENCDNIGDRIYDEVNGHYFVQYFANNGTAESIVKMYPRDTDVILADNPFAYTGYTYVNWSAADGVKYSASAIVNNLAECGQVLVLNAQWSANTYTIKYNANKPSNASGSVINMPGDKTTAYDQKVTLGKAPLLTGWKFDGWYLDAKCTNKVGNAEGVVTNLTSTFNGNVTLYAKWTANTYTVKYDKNNGSGTMANTSHTYDTSRKLANNSFTRSGYTFLGWSWSSTAITPDYKAEQSVINMTATSNETITLYAVWLKTEAYADFTASNETRDKTLVEGDTHTDTVYTDMNKTALLKNGFTSIKIAVVFDAKRKALISFNNAVLNVIANDTVLATSAWDLGVDLDHEKWTSDITVEYTINISELNSDGSFYLVWTNQDDKTWSTGETWYLGETNVSVVAS